MDTGNFPQQMAGGGTESLLPSSLPPVLSRPISYAFDGPTTNITQHTQSTDPPEFRVVHDDPVKFALAYAAANGGIRVPFICAAHRRGPGLLHYDKLPTYEENFCHRSNLLDTLTRKWPGIDNRPLYPISETGGIFSDRVAVYLGPRLDNYTKLNPIPDLPVISVPPVRNPDVTAKGLYSRGEDKSIMRQKICGALRMCVHHRYDQVVIGDFGLGDGFNNPPQYLAEIWRDLLLFDPNLRGQFRSVHFVFTDPLQSTTQCHRDRRQKYNERERLVQMLARDGTSSSRSEGAPSGPSSQRAPTDMEVFESVFQIELSSKRAPTDMAIFESVFHPDEIKRVRKEAASSSSTNMVLS
ncbi:hypothetical protein E4U56_007483 [Claviceps arundinis]|uniref:Microbial-type PARG catalytic domain-containing protein n=1 Tax=Claviceps arundinis TaxID=1623583 RepID=A0A9P7MUU0_9HYPO|nr:hypothetical protein E4U56_007483 [Claviceps arundinis]